MTKDKKRLEDELVEKPKNEDVVSSDSVVSDALSSENPSVSARVADKTLKIHKETTLDFSELDEKVTIEEVSNAAQAVEEDNLLNESPLDKYVRNHRMQVEQVKSSFGEGDAVENAEILSESDGVKEDALSESMADAHDLTSDSADFDSLLKTPVTKVGEAFTVEESENGLLSVTDRFDSLKIESLDAPESAEISTSELAETQAIEGEMLEDAGSPTVIFPIPLAAEKMSEPDAEAAPIHRRSVHFQEAELEKAYPAQTALSETPENPVSADNVEFSEAAQESATAAELTKNKKLRRGLIVGLSAVVLLSAAGGGYAVYQGNVTHQKQVAAQAKKEADAIKTFDTDYVAFFTNSKKTALKNSAFSNLSALKSDLDTINKGSDSYQTRETEYNDLFDDITSIQTVNALFNKAAIVDGKLVKTASVKANVTVPSLTSKNTTIGALLKQATDMATKQLADKKAAAAAQSAAASSAASSAADSSTAASSAATNTAASAATSGALTVTGGSAATDTAPYAWSPGVLDSVLATARARGEISGNDYTLQEAGVHTTNGNIYGHNGVITGQATPIVAGYYDLYRADGTYLFTINCKTGYFFGSTNPTDY
ncbi:MAG: hypothetical protein LBI11_06315 [Streptococcaceae bacterium]|jgi:hypothetical protein|nr:hypothetical protein [Streptococcaceae bacterium]